MNYKRLILIGFILFASVSLSNAQEKIKKFCTLSYRYYGSYDSPSIDYGQTRKHTPLKDSTLVQKLNRVESMANFIQAMNYITGLGWKYEGNISTSHSDRAEVRILFSRDFYPAELTDGK